MKPTGWVTIVAIVVLTIGSFLAGRWSVVPDDQKLRDSLAVYRILRSQDKTTREQLLRDLATEHSLRVKLDSSVLRLTESSARLIAGAARTMVTANETKARTDSILASLRNARTPAESIAVLTMACSERENECALVRKANDSLFRATDSLTAAEDSAKRTIESFRRDSTKLVDRIKNDSTRLVQADRLIGDLEKAAGGCRVPLAEFPCPIPFGSYNVTVSKFEGGAIIPFKIGRFRVGGGITWSP